MWGGAHTLLFPKQCLKEDYVETLEWLSEEMQAEDPKSPGIPIDKEDAAFPFNTFLNLLFGHKSLDELDLAFADAYASNSKGQILLDALFPKQPSWIIPLE